MKLASTIGIALGASYSGAISLGRIALTQIVEPAVLEATSADLIFEGSDDGTTWHPVYTAAGARLRIEGLSTTIARAHIMPDIKDLFGYAYVRFQVVTTGSETPVVQTAARTFKLKARRVN